MPFSNKAKSERLSLSVYNFRIEQMQRIDFECVNKHCVYSRIARVFGAQQCDVRCDMLHGWKLWVTRCQAEQCIAQSLSI